MSAELVLIFEEIKFEGEKHEGVAHVEFDVLEIKAPTVGFGPNEPSEAPDGSKI
jgi:hypothetical protein